MEKTSLALVIAFLILLSAGAAMTAFGWGARIRFYFGLLPFEESRSASVMASDVEGSNIIRPISDRHQLRFTDLIASVTKGEGEVVLEGRHPDVCSLMNRTVPRFSMGWVDPTRIRLFEAEYDVWYIEMWVRDEVLYLNLRCQGEEHVAEKLFLIDDPGLAAEAHDLMMEAWSES
jgi:hypothetical protein